MNTKICSKCGENKSIGDFYRDKRKKDGLYPHCKQCHLTMTARYAQSDKGKQIQSNYWMSDEARAKQRQRASKYRQSRRRPKVYQVKAAKSPRIIKSKPEILARLAVARAVRIGQIPHVQTLPCSHCGNTAKEYHHHQGYDRMHHLDVIPLCIKCHANVHTGDYHHSPTTREKMSQAHLRPKP